VLAQGERRQYHGAASGSAEGEGARRVRTRQKEHGV
jgi:hypothetical protein